MQAIKLYMHGWAKTTLFAVMFRVGIAFCHNSGDRLPFHGAFAPQQLTRTMACFETWIEFMDGFIICNSECPLATTLGWFVTVFSANHRLTGRTEINLTLQGLLFGRLFAKQELWFIDMPRKPVVKKNSLVYVAPGLQKKAGWNERRGLGSFVLLDYQCIVQYIQYAYYILYIL